MSELQRILEKYKSRAGDDSDEQAFMDKHTDNISVFDGPGVEEVKRAVDAVSHNNADGHHGHTLEDAEDMYENFSIEDLRSILESMEVDSDFTDELEKALKESAPSHVLKVIDEAVRDYYDEATDEEKEMLDEMLSSDEGYEELINYIFEKHCEECGDDPCTCDDEDDDDEDGEIDADPEIKEKKYKK